MDKIAKLGTATRFPVLGGSLVATAALASLLALGAGAALPQTALADGTTSVTDLTWSSNTSIDSASALVMDQQVTDATAHDGAHMKWYSFSLAEASGVTIDLTCFFNTYGSDALCVYDATGEEVWNYEPGYDWNSTTQQSVTHEVVHLTAGQYFLCLGDDYYFGAFSLSLAATSDGESFAEAQNGSNNSIGSASPVQLATQYTGQLAENDDVDFYSFALSESGTLRLASTSQWGKYGSDNYRIYDSAGNELWSHDISYDWNDTTRQAVTTEDVELTAGSYFLSVEFDGDGGPDTYAFSLSLTSAGETFPEVEGGSDNSLSTASPIELDTIYRGQIALNDEVDMYAFTLASDTRVFLDIVSTWSTYESIFELYDANGEKVWSDNNGSDWNDVTGVAKTQDETELPAGTYYFAVSRDNQAEGAYAFAWGTQAGALGSFDLRAALRESSAQGGEDEVTAVEQVDTQVVTTTSESVVEDGTYSAVLDVASGTAQMEIVVSGGVVTSVMVRGSVTPAEYAALLAACMEDGQTTGA